ncbi:hypothetical protein [Undibacterium macrobrachii]|uniref:hypothetical protein n=1 Tax=Undibacterium macrobrachii TaxID=1119058 RepID=UPI001675DC80|nr:hypothetical protein [Undibacterium macrobrachii]
MHPYNIGSKSVVPADHPFHPLSFELQQTAPQSKQRIHDLWAQAAGTPHLPPQAVLFSEWPLVASQCLQDKLTQRTEALCQVLQPHLQAQAIQQHGWQHGTAADVLTIDYAIICDGDSWDIRLVEFQAFTSLLTMGYRLHQVHSQLWPQLADCPPWQGAKTEQSWMQASRAWLAGGDNPALLEYQAWQRGTLFDLHASSLLWNMPIVEPHQIEVDANGRLFSTQHGVRQQHDYILNRLILSELEDDAQFLRQLQKSQMNWHSHPAWYFLVHKGLSAELTIPFEPKNVKLSQWHELNLPAQEIVAKNIYSCGGKDLRIGPSVQELEDLSLAGQGDQWLVQPRYRPYPVMRSSNGVPVFAEVRMIVQLQENQQARSQQTRIAMQILRMYCAEQASASFFQGREGEGANILHRPPNN